MTIPQMERDADYVYLIQSADAYFFWAGTTRDSRQVLMGLACPSLVAFFFDLQGHLVDVQKRNLEFLRPSGVYVDGELFPGLVRTYNIYDERIPVRLKEWRQEIGFQEQLIRVKRFDDVETGIRICDYPDHFAEILLAPEASLEEKAEVLDSMAEWEQEGEFVLIWGNDYWLSRDGEVTSS